MKFKVGDVVRVVAPTEYRYESLNGRVFRGQISKVVHMPANREWCHISLEGLRPDQYEKTGGIYLAELEPAIMEEWNADI